MPRDRDEDDDDMEPDEDEYDPDQQALDDELEDEEEQEGRRSSQKRRRSSFIDDVAEEDDDEDEEDDDDDDEEYGAYRGGGKNNKSKSKSKKKKRGMSGADFLDLEAEVDSDDEEEEEEGDDDFIEDGTDIPEEGGRRRMHRPQLLDDQQEDVEDLERRIQARYAKQHTEYAEDATDNVDQQALLPSVMDPKLWLVKCAIGKEREVAACLMQKYIDKPEINIRSAIALDHLKNYVYVEAEKEAHVREACKGMRNLFLHAKISLVPIREMTDVLSVESKAIEVSRDTWVRMKIGIYKGDLAKVTDVDNVRQRVTVKLIPRIDLQALASKLEGREVVKKKAFVPPPRFMNIDEARELHIRVERKRDPMTGDYFENIEKMMFKDGFLYKVVSMKSISTQNIHPTFDELEKFRKPGENGEGDVASLSTLFSNRKKGHFLKGDAVIIIRGDLKNLKGRVEKVEEGTVHIRPEMKDLPKTLAINEKDLCKYFEPGNHVKVVSGSQEGATGMVVKVEQHVLILLSDTTKEHLRVFADDVVESSEVTSGITKIGDFELHDLVLLDNNSFGVIIRVETEACQVLKGVAERPEVALIKQREIKCKIDKKLSVQDCFKNTISVKDVVRVVEGPSKGKQGPVEHIYRGVLFIYDRHHIEHAGFICVKSLSCRVVGGSRTNGDRNGDSYSRFDRLRAPPAIPQSPRRFNRGGPPNNFGGRNRGGRGHDGLVGTTVKIRQGAYKGYRGRVVEVKGTSVRVELESQMKVVTVDRSCISDNVAITTPYRDTSGYGMGSQTPIHPSRTPLHPYMTPMRDAGATPIHDGMRTPMRDRAWNPYAPMSPARDSWEDGNPGSWGSSPQYQPGTPASRPYEAPTPGSGWANTPGGSYSEAGTPRDSTGYANAPSPYMPSTPGGQPMTPNSASYLPGTPGGQPMTPGTGLDMMSPVIGGDTEGPWFMPDIMVNLHHSGEETTGIIREVLLDGSCRVALGSGGNGTTVTVHPNEMEVIAPRKNDKIKIMGGSLRGFTGKLIGVDGTDGIVKGQNPLFPRILGHEAGGIVESVGEGVTELQPGDHVLPVFTGECKECRHCKSEESNMCDLLRINTDRGTMLADGKRRFSKDGKPINHFLGTSTFSEYTVSHVGSVAKINPAAPVDKVCILSCGICTGFGATVNVAKPKKGSSIAIFGLGAVGLAVSYSYFFLAPKKAAEGARVSGASRIIGVDLNPIRFEEAKKFGVNEFVNPKDHKKPVQEVIAEMMDGGVDRSVECTGNIQAMTSAFECVHDGWGVAVLVGVPNKDDAFKTHPMNFLNERTLKGTFYGNYKPRTDLPGVVEKYMNKEMELDKFITHSVPFLEINKAFDYMLAGEGIRCIIRMEH